MKIEGSGSISQRHGSADPDPDPHQNVMDPEHCFKVGTISVSSLGGGGGIMILGITSFLQA
jgi:hypothetical protein